ncbi:possible tyrosine transporter P-protein [Treponema bryantii]|uniref:Possible tyrosine transporter P-protein n=1 Tax=Treponema bryantii TaxID=163 RepID=A0A1H9G0Q3_9SPIR|nr:SLC13 family permease [Treponema bryantii]SEQ43671.1 possible tyrosine transporter P-protein [Treponema bryantii]
MDIKFIILALALVMYLLVIIFQEKKVWMTSVAALAVVVLGFLCQGGAIGGNVFSQLAGPAELFQHIFFELINWNILMIYVGSMIIAALFIYSRVPARIADALVTISPSTGIAVVLILAMTGIISIFVENVATVLVMAPIALALSRKLKLNPVPFMIGLALMSNLEGTATLVGDPPSMIFASYAHYTFNDFFVSQGKISIFFFIQAGLLVGCIFFYCFFSKAKEKATVDKEEVISYVPLWLLLIMIAGLAVISFLSSELGYSSGCLVLGLGMIGLVWYHLNQKKTYGEVWQLVKELDWETIAFLIGIFVVVGAISETGLLGDFALWLAHVTGGSKFLGFLLILLFSILISGFVDNVPYIIVMLPVAGNLAQAMSIQKELFMFALLIGSCLGGNLTPFGASANVVAMGILKKEGHPITFPGFLKISAPFTVLTTAAAAALLWAIWA